MHPKFKEKDAPQQKKSSDTQRDVSTFSNDNSKSLSSEHTSGFAYSQSGNLSPVGQGKVAMQFKSAPENTRLNVETEQSIQRKANNTGLPDTLKTGIENLSGYSMNDVKVHYNSSKPAQLQAHAYAQGTNIHLGPGQERHLPHEAWHVVQQKQGRVRPTVQMKGKVGVNTDAGLEREADVMGGAALKVQPIEKSYAKPPRQNNCGKDLGLGATAQLFARNKIGNEDAQFEHIKDMKMHQLIAYQVEFQKKVKGYPESYSESITTVGFEHEFAEAKTYKLGKKRDHPLLKGIDHLELAKSVNPKMVFTGIPFILETDSNCVIELVSPPFLLQTLFGKPLPTQKLVDKVDEIMRDGLISLARGAVDIKGLIGDFNKIHGIDFELEEPNLQYYHVDHATSDQTIERYRNGRVTKQDLERIPINKQTKSKDDEIGQANIATDMETAYLMEDPPEWLDIGYHQTMQKEIIVSAFECLKTMVEGRDKVRDKKMFKFIHTMARVLLTQIAVKPLEMLVDYQKEKYETHKSSHQKAKWNSVVDLTSFVKDNAGVWMKDSIINIGLGLGLEGYHWAAIEKLTENEDFVGAVRNVGENNNILKKYIKSFVRSSKGIFFPPEDIRELRNTIRSHFKTNIVNSLSVLGKEAEIAKFNTYGEDYFVPKPDKLPLYGHDGTRHIRARQDTLLPYKAVNSEAMKILWPYRRLLVVEIRRNGPVLDLARDRSDGSESEKYNTGEKGKLSKEYDALVESIWHPNGR